LLTLNEPAVLVLDEPTNHLDLDMREALALALQDFGGALVLVSHDRSLLARVVDELWVVQDGRVASFEGDLSSYATTRIAAAPRAAAHDRRTARQDGAAARQREKPLRDRVRRLEDELERVTTKLTEVERPLADVDVYNALAPAELDRLLAESGRLRKRLEAIEAEWFEAQEALEAGSRSDA